MKSRPNILVPLPANFPEPPIPAPAKNGHPGQAQILIQVGYCTQGWSKLW
ncbi:MAG: hypothetical protein GY820_06045 [Gammaproteobacteria bacterium]|nr:hypothetical protein [Gammaproteobacteria bacterium]